MKKYFNTTGPCNNKAHYMVPVLERNSEIMPLIEQGHYFVIHAARQTGKTTLLKTLTNHINSKDDYYALYCSLESVQVFTEPEKGIREILNNLKKVIRYSKIPNKEKFAENTENETASTLISVALSDFCIILKKPLIIFFDEIDGLENGTLVTFLRQLRDGYISRYEIPFVYSTALVGLRDVRDYKTKIREGRNTLGSKSPFNIIEKTLSLKNFSRQEISDLYHKHTEATEQVFENSCVEYIYEQSCGQPWLVNAVAKEVIDEILKNDFSKPVTKESAEQAIQNIILRRDTHIDSLIDKLKEDRVRKIIEPVILTTEKSYINYNSDDLQYCIDLGLIKKEKSLLKPANPIYTEVIIRELSHNTQSHFETDINNVWINNSGEIDMEALLKAFQQFWRENSDIWIEKYQYKEAAPHLILQAFLQRIINGGGDILREYSYGKKRIDLYVRYGKNKYPLELKLHYGKKTKADGLTQLAEYMDGYGEKTGWLIIFDRDENKTWEQKIYWETEKYQDKIIHIVGC